MCVGLLTGMAQISPLLPVREPALAAGWRRRNFRRRPDDGAGGELNGDCKEPDRSPRDPAPHHRFGIPLLHETDPGRCSKSGGTPEGRR